MGVDVLVVDDDADIREAITDLLVEEGFEVRVLGSADGLGAALEEFRPRVMLLDLTMPGFDPEHDLPPLREGGLLDGVTVYVVSGLPDTDARARSLGLDGAVRKPFELDTLLDRLSDACADEAPSPSLS